MYLLYKLLMCTWDGSGHTGGEAKARLFTAKVEGWGGGQSPSGLVGLNHLIPSLRT